MELCNKKYRKGQKYTSIFILLSLTTDTAQLDDEYGGV